jgi:hypothetical protein
VEDFVELRVARHLVQRPYLDTFLFDRQHKHRDAAVFRSTEVGAGEQDCVLALLSSRCPYLLSGDDPLVAVELGFGVEPGEVGASAGLGVHLRPHLLPTEASPEKTLLQVVRGMIS